MVPQCSAEQQQRGQRKQIGVDHPLHLLRARAVALPDGGQRDAEHRSFDEGQAGGEDARNKRPCLLTLGTRPFACPGAHSAVSIASSTMRDQVSASPTAAIFSSGSRIVWRTASAWFTCSLQTRSIFSPAEGSLPSAL